MAATAAARARLALWGILVQGDPSGHFTVEGEAADILELEHLAVGEIEETHLVTRGLTPLAVLLGRLAVRVDREGDPGRVFGEGQRCASAETRGFADLEPMLCIARRGSDNHFTVPLVGGDSVGKPLTVVRDGRGVDSLPCQCVG